jgi:hypothetical protein
MAMRRFDVLFGLAVACLGPSCADVTPLPFHAVEVNDAATDGAALAACKACIKDPGAPCRSSWDACLALSGCDVLADCLFDAVCFAYDKIEEQAACAGPCLEKYASGVGTDPRLLTILNIRTCALSGCTSECFNK